MLRLLYGHCIMRWSAHPGATQYPISATQKCLYEGCAAYILETHRFWLLGEATEPARCQRAGIRYETAAVSMNTIAHCTKLPAAYYPPQAHADSARLKAGLAYCKQMVHAYRVNRAVAVLFYVAVRRTTALCTPWQWLVYSNSVLSVKYVS